MVREERRLMSVDNGSLNGSSFSFIHLVIIWTSQYLVKLKDFIFRFKLVTSSN